MNIQDRLKAGIVKRWNIVNTTREQTLAEHLFNVTMIAGEIVKKDRELAPSMLVLRYALVHDLAEVILGDIPTPTKARMKEAGFDFNELERSVFPVKIPEGLVGPIVKVADLVEAHWFIRVHGLGRHAEMITKRLRIARDEFIDQQEPELKSAAMAVIRDIEEGEITI